MERRIGTQWSRGDARRRLGASRRGLLKPVERKNGWQLAEANGDHAPYGVQHLLRAVWDPEAVRDELRGYVLEPLGVPEGVLVIDETGFLKKGKHSAGVARQDSGTAGRVEHCQIGVLLTYARARGQVVLDRDLYLPEVWTQDRARCAGAGSKGPRWYDWCWLPVAAPGSGAILSPQTALSATTTTVVLWKVAPTQDHLGQG